MNPARRVAVCLAAGAGIFFLAIYFRKTIEEPRTTGNQLLGSAPRTQAPSVSAPRMSDLESAASSPVDIKGAADSHTKMLDSNNTPHRSNADEQDGSSHFARRKEPHSNGDWREANSKRGDAAFPADAETRIWQVLSADASLNFISIDGVVCQPTICEIRYTGGPDLSDSRGEDRLMLPLLKEFPMFKSGWSSSRVELAPGVFRSVLTIRTYIGNDLLGDYEVRGFDGSGDVAERGGQTKRKRFE